MAFLYKSGFKIKRLYGLILLMIYVNVWKQRKREDHIIACHLKNPHNKTNCSLNVHWFTVGDGCKTVICTYKSFAKYFLDMGDIIIDSEVVAEDAK